MDKMRFVFCVCTKDCILAIMSREVYIIPDDLVYDLVDVLYEYDPFILLKLVCTSSSFNFWREKYYSQSVYLVNHDAYKGMKVSLSDAGKWLRHLTKERIFIQYGLSMPNYIYDDVRRVNTYRLWDIKDSLSIYTKPSQIPRGYTIEYSDENGDSYFVELDPME